MLSRLWAQMRASLFLSDEEMVKKDDDHHKAGPSLLRNPHWQPAPPVPKRRRTFRRVLLLALALVSLWIFLKYLSLDLGFDSNHTSRYSYQRDHPHYVSPHRGGRSSGNGLDAGRKGGGGGGDVAGASERNFDGPIKFHELAATLRGLTGTRGGMTRNRNVLFMAASLQSAAALLPMACDMGREQRNFVHFALISRDYISMKDLARVNGIDESCQLYLHDARPDYGDIASETRMHHATTRALFHIQNYMHPQAVIVDASDQEEKWFHKGARRQADFMGVPLIELPEGGVKQLSWMAKLDSDSIAAWDKISVDIVIQAPPSGAGSLLRLLKSLTQLDFSGSTIPHLTVELPAMIEPSVQSFLEAFRWPPPRVANTRDAQMLSLRRRIPRERLTEEESSARFLESFWPRTPGYSHVLVLTPQAELSPQFLHYLKFSMLQYFYSKAAMSESWPQRLLGLSMSIPQLKLDGSEALAIPPPVSGEGSQAEKGQTSFLSQAPSSDVMLITGTRWVELQGLVSRSLEKQHGGGAGVPDMLTSKVVGKQHPSWLEHAVRLSRARGYLTLYPDPDTAATLATVHQDLFRAPEEYEKDLKQELRDGVVDEMENHETRPTTPLLSIANTLPNGGDLPALGEVPMSAWDGSTTTLGELDRMSIKYMIEWRQTVGGCEADDTDSMQSSPTAKDLFCD